MPGIGVLSMSPTRLAHVDHLRLLVRACRWPRRDTPDRSGTSSGRRNPFAARCSDRAAESTGARRCCAPRTADRSPSDRRSAGPGTSDFSSICRHRLAVELKRHAFGGFHGDLAVAHLERAGARRRARRKHDVVQRIGAERRLRLREKPQAGDRQPARVPLQRGLAVLAEFRRPPPDRDRLGIGSWSRRLRRFRQPASTPEARTACSRCARKSGARRRRRSRERSHEAFQSYTARKSEGLTSR